MSKLVGGWSDKNENLKMDVVPLFETVDDLKKADFTMNELYLNHNYNKHLNSRKYVQNIMCGFSDGTKDGGYLAANWNIY